MNVQFKVTSIQNIFHDWVDWIGPLTIDTANWAISAERANHTVLENMWTVGKI